MTAHIHLTVSFICQTVDDEEYLPSECNTLESIELAFPSMEAKYVVFPKLIEGATEQVIESHRAKVRDYLHKKAEEERKRQERQQLEMWNTTAQEAA